jgi:hypothetical protein
MHWVGTQPNAMTAVRHRQGRCLLAPQRWHLGRVHGVRTCQFGLRQVQRDCTALAWGRSKIGSSAGNARAVDPSTFQKLHVAPRQDIQPRKHHCRGDEHNVVDSRYVVKRTSTAAPVEGKTGKATIWRQGCGCWRWWPGGVAQGAVRYLDRYRGHPVTAQSTKQFFTQSDQDSQDCQACNSRLTKRCGHCQCSGTAESLPKPSGPVKSTSCATAGSASQLICRLGRQHWATGSGLAPGLGIGVPVGRLAWGRLLP